MTARGVRKRNRQPQNAEKSTYRKVTRDCGAKTLASSWKKGRKTTKRRAEKEAICLRRWSKGSPVIFHKLASSRGRTKEGG